MRASIAVGIVNFACNAIARCTGLSRARVLTCASLDEGQLRRPDETIDVAALIALLRFARAHTRDPGIGLRLAQLVDLREQGLWGYSVLASHDVRERVDVHVRYQELRAPWQLAFSEDAGIATLELIPREIPRDVLPLLIDWIMATALLHLSAHLGRKPNGVQLRLGYAAAPHHAALAALFDGEIEFDAPATCLRAPSELLARQLPGDPQLGRLLREQLDARLQSLRAQAPHTLADRVRERVAARLDHDASLVRIARDLRMSARTLQRQLEANATSFNELVEDVRRTHALRFVTETDHSVVRVAAALGYADASSFRRAFRRWTGLSPTRFRSARRTNGALAPIVPTAARKVSVA